MNPCANLDTRILPQVASLPHDNQTWRVRGHNRQICESEDQADNEVRPKFCPVERGTVDIEMTVQLGYRGCFERQDEIYGQQKNRTPTPASHDNFTSSLP
jgi:hypothetical protein